MDIKKCVGKKLMYFFEANNKNRKRIDLAIKKTMMFFKREKKSTGAFWMLLEVFTLNVLVKLGIIAIFFG